MSKYQLKGTNTNVVRVIKIYKDFYSGSLFILQKFTKQEDLEMSEKSKKKNEIIIINKFKETNAESVTVTLAKVFEIFCNMQTIRKY